MAVDPTFNETESSPEESRDEALVAQRTPGPPRPPRPGKRKGSGRIPMPTPPGHQSLDQDSLESDAAPGVDFDDERDEAFPLISPRSKRQGLVPEESFADIGAELQDHAPPAPVTPRRGGSSLELEPVEDTPPRPTPAATFEHDDPEPTIVGRVPHNLLELSSTGEENTRAFTAPRELIELARRRREERLDSRAPADAHLRDTQRPARDVLPEGADAAPPIPADSAPPERIREEDAAPPIARGESGEMDAVAMPRAASPDSGAGRSSGPVIEVEPASDGSISVSFESARSAPVAPRSEPLPSRIPTGMSLKPALFVAALFVLIGVVLARWRELVQLMR